MLIQVHMDNLMVAITGTTGTAGATGAAIHGTLAFKSHVVTSNYPTTYYSYISQW